jgi:hypothetical protein
MYLFVLELLQRNRDSRYSISNVISIENTDLKK